MERLIEYLRATIEDKTRERERLQGELDALQSTLAAALTIARSSED